MTQKLWVRGEHLSRLTQWWQTSVFYILSLFIFQVNIQVIKKGWRRRRGTYCIPYLSTPPTFSQGYSSISHCSGPSWVVLWYKIRIHYSNTHITTKEWYGIVKNSANICSGTSQPQPRQLRICNWFISFLIEISNFIRKSSWYFWQNWCNERYIHVIVAEVWGSKSLIDGQL